MFSFHKSKRVSHKRKRWKSIEREKMKPKVNLDKSNAKTWKKQEEAFLKSKKGPCPRSDDAS